MASAFKLADYLVSGQPESYISGLNSTITDRLYALYQAAPASVRSNLLILSGARSSERQQQLWDAALKKYGSAEKARKWVAPPGKSQHNHGNAVDFKYLNAEAKKWVHEHAGEYGLYFRMGNEPWHVEPIPNWKGSVPPIPKVDIPPAAPIPANLTRGIDQKRMAYAQQAGGNGRGGFDSPRTAEQLGDIYSGILPPNGSDPTGRGATLAELLSFNPERTRVASIDPTVGMPRLPAPIAATPNLNIPDGSNLPRADVSYSTGLGAFMTPEAREEAISRMASLGQTSVRPIGMDMLDLAMRDARMPQPLPRLPAPVRVPTGANADPVGNGVSLADLSRFNQPSRGSPQHTASLDPAGIGSSYADVIRFNPTPSRPPQSTTSGSSATSGRYDPVGNGASYSALRDFVSPVKSSGIAGTVVLPHNVTPQVPQILPPAAAPKPTTRTVTETVMVRNPAYIPPKGSVVTPTGGTITQSQMDAIRAVPANSYMKPITPAPNVPEFIPKQVTRTITVPAPAAKPVAPAPAPVAPTPMPYGAGASARANAVNLVQGTNGYFYMPNPDGSYTSMRTQDQALARQRAIEMTSRPGTSPMLAPRGLPPIPMPYGSRPGFGRLPALPGMVPGAVGIPRAQTFGSTLGDWWSRTLLGRIGNAVTGRPQAPFGGLLGVAAGDVRSPFAGFGGSTFAAPSQHSLSLAQAAAAQAQRDPLGAAIGAANRASPSPTYDISGGNNAFNPQSVQNSSRWQTGY